MISNLKTFKNKISHKNPIKILSVKIPHKPSIKPSKIPNLMPGLKQQCLGQLQHIQRDLIIRQARNNPDRVLLNQFIVISTVQQNQTVLRGRRFPT